MGKATPAAMRPRVPKWHNRRHRRPLVVLLGAGLVVMAVALGLSDTQVINDPLWFAGVAVTLLAWLLLRMLTGGIAERIMPGLDERERALRGRFAYIGFQLATFFIFAMFVYMVAAQNLPSLDRWAAGLMFLLGCIAGALPTALLGWNLPDDDPEDFAGSDESRRTSTATDREDSGG